MTGWTAIVPAKSLDAAKSRLRVPHRRELANAMTFDVLDALLRADDIRHVIIVTNDPLLARRGVRSGCTVVPDAAHARMDPLNAAVATGVAEARHVAVTRPVVIVPTDLACLDECALRGALERLGRHRRAFIPDRTNVGTTLVAASAPDLVRTTYGALSALKHHRAGWVPVRDVSERVRLDVDTVSDLRAAVDLGVGQHTSDALARWRATLRQFEASG